MSRCRVLLSVRLTTIGRGVCGRLTDECRWVAEQRNDEFAGLVTRRFDCGNAIGDRKGRPCSGIGQCFPQPGDGQGVDIGSRTCH
jgi:hypothetical protein